MKKSNNTEDLSKEISDRLKVICEEVMDIDALCAFIHLDKPTIYALTSQRRIPHTKPTGKLLFLKSDIVKWLKDNQVKTQVEIKSSIDNRK